MSFEARYRAPCAACPSSIEPGDLVTYDDDELVHDECLRVWREDAKAACPTCWLIHAGGCYE